MLQDTCCNFLDVNPSKLDHNKAFYAHDSKQHSSTQTSGLYRQLLQMVCEDLQTHIICHDYLC